LISQSIKDELIAKDENIKKLKKKIVTTYIKDKIAKGTL
jgi:hypothetical protein